MQESVIYQDIVQKQALIGLTQKPLKPSFLRVLCASVVRFSLNYA